MTSFLNGALNNFHLYKNTFDAFLSANARVFYSLQVTATVRSPNVEHLAPMNVEQASQIHFHFTSGCAAAAS